MQLWFAKKIFYVKDMSMTGGEKEENALKSVLIIFEQPLFRIELKQESSLKNQLFIIQ